MSSQGQIWLGELLRCWHTLEPADEDTRARFARALGFDWLPPGTVALPAAPAALAPPIAERLTPAPPSEPPAPAPAFPPVAAAELPRAADALLDADPVREWQSVPPLERLDVSATAHMPALPPLFRPEWSRTIAATLAARRLPLGPVDGARLARDAASGRPIGHIPHLPRWTLRRGLQLLIDVAPGMEPFAGDQIELAEHLTACIGSPRLESWFFHDCPSRGVFATADTLPYRPPPPGVPVIAVTDLGLGGPWMHFDRAQPAEWLALADLLAARGSRLAALVPWPSAHVAPALTARMAVVEWDRPTSAARIRRLLERFDE